MTLARRAAAEALGTALLLAAIVGSGIMGERLAGGNVALALLANSLATGFALIALVVAFAERSGAHFNPVVTLALAIRGDHPKGEVLAYVLAQALGAVAGVGAAHAMFELDVLQLGAKARSGPGQWWSEAVATFGLVFVVLSLGRRGARSAPFAIGGYITAAYWFTASTSFANPAVTLARCLTGTFAGIDPRHAPAFIACELAGAALACGADRLLRPPGNYGPGPEFSLPELSRPWGRCGTRAPRGSSPASLPAVPRPRDRRSG